MFLFCLLYVLCVGWLVELGERVSQKNLNESSSGYQMEVENKAPMVKVEVCVDSVTSAIAAEEGGASRFFYC
jgi:hypothetical protein